MADTSAGGYTGPAGVLEESRSQALPRAGAAMSRDP